MQTLEIIKLQISLNIFSLLALKYTKLFKILICIFNLYFCENKILYLNLYKTISPF